MPSHASLAIAQPLSLLSRATVLTNPTYDALTRACSLNSDCRIHSSAVAASMCSSSFSQPVSEHLAAWNGSVHMPQRYRSMMPAYVVRASMLDT